MGVCASGRRWRGCVLCAVECGTVCTPALQQQPRTPQMSGTTTTTSPIYSAVEWLTRLVFVLIDPLAFCSVQTIPSRSITLAPGNAVAQIQLHTATASSHRAREPILGVITTTAVKTGVFELNRGVRGHLDMGSCFWFVDQVNTGWAADMQLICSCYAVHLSNGGRRSSFCCSAL